MWISKRDFKYKIRELLQDSIFVNWNSVGVDDNDGSYTTFSINTSYNDFHSLSFYHNLVDGDKDNITVTEVKYTYLQENLTRLLGLVKEAMEEDEDGNIIIPLKEKRQERMLALNNLNIVCTEIEEKRNILLGLIKAIKWLNTDDEFVIYEELKYLINIIDDYIKTLNSIYTKMNDIRSKFSENKNESKNYLSSK